MNSNKKFALGKAPFIRKADLTSQHTSNFMLDLIIALTPLIIFGWVKNGLIPFIEDKTNFLGLIYPLLLPLCGGLFSFLLELGWWGLIVKKRPLKDRMKTSYAIIPGLMLGMIVSVSTPLWVLFMGCIFATVVAKLLFGGFGHNIFNPALIGFLFLTSYSYIGLMSGSVDANGAKILNSFGAWGYLNPREVGMITSGATPMSEFASSGFAGFAKLIEDNGLFKMFVGLNPGAVAETSALLCLVGLIYLLVRKVINWRIPVIYIGTVFVLTYIIGALNGYAGTLDFALFGIFNGGLMFGAVFMATEPVTSPRNPNGKVIYALGLAVITVVFRFASKSPEGVAVAILTMNMFTAIIERFAAKIRVEPNKKKMVLAYSLVGLLLAGIATFPVVKSIPQAVAYEYVSSEQDYKTLDFIYKFKAKDVEFNVITDQSFAIKSISNSDFNNDAAKTELLKFINDNKIYNYIKAAEETVDYLKVTVITAGFGGKVESIITYDNDFKITEFTVTYNESYESGEWNAANGHPKDVLPPQIIANQDDLSKVNVVAGATYTSNAIIKAVDVAKDYIAYLDTITELTLIGKAQDLGTLDFIYVFRGTPTGKLLVRTDTDYTIKSDVDDSIKADVEAKITANKFAEYYVSKTDNTIVIKTNGFASTITTTVTFDSEYKITNITTNDLRDAESYTDGEWQSSSGHPQDVIPAQIIANQTDLSAVTPVAGATYTSRAIIKAGQMALDYLNYLEGTDE
jgi:electron transport complex protein RnfD